MPRPKLDSVREPTSAEQLPALTEEQRQELMRIAGFELDRHGRPDAGSRAEAHAVLDEVDEARQLWAKKPWRGRPVPDPEYLEEGTGCRVLQDTPTVAETRERLRRYLGAVQGLERDLVAVLAPLDDAAILAIHRAAADHPAIEYAGGSRRKPVVTDAKTGNTEIMDVRDAGFGSRLAELRGDLQRHRRTVVDLGLATEAAITALGGQESRGNPGKAAQRALADRLTSIFLCQAHRTWERKSGPLPKGLLSAAIDFLLVGASGVDGMPHRRATLAKWIEEARKSLEASRAADRAFWARAIRGVIRGWPSPFEDPKAFAHRLDREIEDTLRAHLQGENDEGIDLVRRLLEALGRAPAEAEDLIRRKLEELRRQDQR